jgi:quercetin dioxygenase-like cupin family protein
MSTKTGRWTMAGFLAVCVLGGIAAGTAWATAGSGITTTPISGPARLGETNAGSESGGHEVEIKTKGQSDVYVSHLSIVPGGHGGWHSHPGPSIISVKSGQATFYQGDDPDRTPHVYLVGSSFVEDGGDVHIVRNEGSTNLELVVLQIVPAGAPRRIDQPKPAHYDF